MIEYITTLKGIAHECACLCHFYIRKGESEMRIDNNKSAVSRVMKLITVASILICSYPRRLQTQMPGPRPSRSSTQFHYRLPARSM